jgi:hypothetical protein
MRLVSWCVLAVASLLPVTLAAPAHAAWPTDPYSGVPLATASGEQDGVAACADGAGGAYVAWRDRGTDPNGDIRLQRLGADGATAAGWPAGGLAVCALAGGASDVALLPGPAGSCYVLWLDLRTGAANRDVYLTRVQADASIAPGWPANGLLVSRADFDEWRPLLASDGADGAYVAWELIFNAGNDDYDIYARRVGPGGTFPAGFSLPLVIAGSGASESTPALAADGAGGAFIVWQDLRSVTSSEIYGQRLLANGGSAWSAGGTPLATHATNSFARPAVSGDGAGGGLLGTLVYVGSSTYPIQLNRFGAKGAPLWPYPAFVGSTEALAINLLEQTDIRVIPDAGGGAYVAWNRFDGFKYVTQSQRVSPAGALRWAASGLPVIDAPNWNGAGSQYDGTAPIFDMTGDGQGGLVMVVAADIDGSGTEPVHIHAQRFDAAGTRRFGAQGVVVTEALVGQAAPALTPDGRGGFVSAWADLRSLSSADVYAARFDAWGYLGDAAPVATSALDVPLDQGGWVEVRWNASHLDALPERVVRQYSLWRALPGAPPAGTTRLGEREARPAGAARVARAVTADGVTTWWEYLALKGAATLPQYAAVLPTTTDSMPGSNPLTQFMVQAEGFFGDPFWASAPIAAYSADDLAPAMPQPFTGTYAGGTTTMEWGANGEPDLAGYRLYRGTSAGFVPSLANRIATPVGTSYADVAGSPYLYRVSAVDLHGNEGPSALLVPGGVLDADAVAPPRALALHGARPNPLRAGGAIHYAMPRAGHASLALYDASGRRVRVLVDGEVAAGEHAAAWDGRDDGGRALPAGLFFARLEAQGRTLAARVARVE